MTFGEALALMVSALSAPNLEQASVTYEVQVGDEHMDDNSAPPRIVIVPMSSQPGGPRLQQPPAARALAGETHLFRAELWGKLSASDTTTTVGRDYIAVSTMRATFTMAMRAAFGTSFQLGPGEWGETQGESTDKDGRTFLQQFTLSALMLDATPTAQTVAHTITNIGVTDPGVSFTNP